MNCSSFGPEDLLMWAMAIVLALFLTAALVGWAVAGWNLLKNR